MCTADRGSSAAQGAGQLRPRRGSLAAEGWATVRRAGATGLLILRANSAFYGPKICRAADRAGAYFSLTARMIVRRVKRLPPGTVVTGQGELFNAYRHHA